MVDVPELFQRGNMLIEVCGFRGPDGEGVDPGVAQAKKRVEGHRAERGGQIRENFRWFVEHASLVIGTDDENPHVVPVSGLKGAVVLLKDVVPMEIHIIEKSAGNQFLHQIRGSMGRKSNPPTKSLFLPFSRPLQATTRTKGPIQGLPVIDPVQGKEVYPWKPKTGKGGLENLFKLIGVGLRSHLGLKNIFLSWDLL